MPWNNGICGKCGARRIDEQLGAEPSPDCGTHGQAQCGRCYVCQTVRWCREVRRVLRDDGVFFLNLGDSYSSGIKSGCGLSREQAAWLAALIDGEGCIQIHQQKRDGYADAFQLDVSVGQKDRQMCQHTRETNLPPGNLIGVPWRVALALQADGWTLRSECPWMKRNSMPESADTRPGKSLEYFFMLTKGMSYFFDMEAVRKEGRTVDRSSDFIPDSEKDIQEDTKRTAATGASRNGRSDDLQSGRNFRNSDLWFESVDAPRGLCGVGDELIGLDVTINGFKGAHFATFPTRLIEPLIKASTSERGRCSRCGAPWQRILDKERIATRPGNDTKVVVDGERQANSVTGNRDPERHVTQTRTVGWEPTCRCNADVVPCVVLETFLGSGTTALVSNQLGRHCVGVELSKEYFAMAVERLERHLGAEKYNAVQAVAPPEFDDPFA